jgi:hypothetical protein
MCVHVCSFGYGGFLRCEHTCAGQAKLFKDDGTFFRDIDDSTW